MNIVEINSVKIFGKALEKVASQQLDRFSLNSDLIIHLLRHYKTIPIPYIDELVTNGMNRNTVEAALNTIGSKFELNLENEAIQTPTLLFQRAVREGKRHLTDGEILWIKRQGRKYTSFSFHTNQPVGYDSLIKIQELTNTQKNKLVQKPRGSIAGDEFNVWTVSELPRAATNKVTVEIFADLVKTELLHISIYPGSLAPDLPNRDQSNEEREYSASFWQTVAFIQE